MVGCGWPVSKYGMRHGFGCGKGRRFVSKPLNLMPRPEAKDHNLPWVHWSSAGTSRWRTFKSSFQFLRVSLIILLKNKRHLSVLLGWHSKYPSCMKTARWDAAFFRPPFLTCFCMVWDSVLQTPGMRKNPMQMDVVWFQDIKLWARHSDAKANYQDVTSSLPMHGWDLTGFCVAILLIVPYVHVVPYVYIYRYRLR